MQPLTVNNKNHVNILNTLNNINNPFLIELEKLIIPR